MYVSGRLKPAKERSMAITHDYVDYLDEQITIAPAGSQEEFQAAQLIADEMRLHGLEPSVEEFDVHSISSIETACSVIVMFVGIILAGVGNVALFIIGVLLTLGVTALFVMKHINSNDVLANLGPRMRSQNVVAKHEATGALVAKGNRPIVIVAHYDSPHENALYKSPVANYIFLVKKYCKYCVLGIAVCALVQLFRFLPDGVRMAFWIVGIIVALPLVVIAVMRIAERFSPCTIGANDNKSSVAALLGILENVRPTGRRPESHRPAAPALLLAPPKPQGKRRGEEVLSALNILPEDCEIEYVERDQSLDANETAELENAAESLHVCQEHDSGSEDTNNAAVTVEDEVDATMQQVHQSVEGLNGDVNDATVVAPPVEEADAQARTQNSFARRASLFDLPDPSGEEVDPFIDKEETEPENYTSAQEPDEVLEEKDSPFETISRSEEASTPTPEAKRRSFRLFNRKDNNPLDDWKGGAATREGLRNNSEVKEETTESEVDVADAATEPTEEELRDAILAMADEKLVSHDIWFVALGASDLDHAGMKNFLSKHRMDIRGAFLINLDCIGAGKLSILQNEGSVNTRLADRRMIRMITTAAKDLHVDIETTDYDWDSTDSTQAMRNSVRSVTLMGLGDNKLPALSRLAEDVYENVDAEQCVDTAALVTELIRRS